MLYRSFISAYNGSFFRGDNDRTLEVVGTGTPATFATMHDILTTLVENAGGVANADAFGPVGDPVFVEWDKYDHLPYSSPGWSEPC